MSVTPQSPALNAAVHRLEHRHHREAVAALPGLLRAERGFPLHDSARLPGFKLIGGTVTGWD